LTCDDNPGVQVASVTIGLGETKTCTFVNDDISPTITLEKVILNGPAGTATQDDFQALLNDGSVPWDTSQDVLANQGHKIGETGLTAYVIENYEFVGITGDAKCPTELKGNTDNLDLDEHITCTITNRQKAKIIIEKEVVGLNDCKDFTFLMIDGVTQLFLLDDDEGVECSPDSPDKVDQPKEKEFLVSPGVGQIAIELNPEGDWEFDDIVCTSLEIGSVIQTDIPQRAVGILPEIGDEIRCVFYQHKPFPTRTQGFWKTHVDFTNDIIFQGPAGGIITLGDTGDPGNFKTIDNKEKLFGTWWSWIPRDSDRNKRDKIDKARMQMSRQCVATKLNCIAFGCSTGTQNMLDAADAAFSGSDIQAIRDAAGECGAYNENGETELPIPYTPGPASGKESKEAATKAGRAYWDILPGP
jgi:hypothetical protein